MHLFRRAAFRAISATPSSLTAKPRSITTVSRAVFTPRPRWTVSSIQRRFISDESLKQESSEALASEEATQSETVIDSQVNTQAQEQPVVKNVLYVGNLFFEVSEKQLQGIFANFGNVTDVKIVQDHRGLSRGFGYITFEHADDANAAVENLNQQVFEGRRLNVQFHVPRERKSRDDNIVPRSPNQPSKTLFIGNMSFEMSDRDLNDLFREIRNVMDVRVAIDRRTGQPRGFAHADFVDVESAVKAKEILESKELYGRRLRVDYSRSSSESTRRANDTIITPVEA